MEAFDTLRPPFDRSSARRDEPWAASQARSSGVLAKVSVPVSDNYTRSFSKPKLLSGNKAELPYALSMGFKERLREARLTAGPEGKPLSGTVLGSKIAVSKATISHWENGRYEPSLEQLMALCDQLQVSADWLLGRETTTLSAEALKEARAYQALPEDARRKWRAMRLTMFSTA
jgi:transcriptional regulator with XRE-family HTH domain